MKDVKFYQLEGKNVLALLSGSVEGAEPIAVGSVDAAKEKHIPVVKRVGDKLEVTVGSVIHPMLEEHHIEWIALATDDKLDIEKAVKDAEQYAAEDAKIKEKVEVRNQADQMVYQSEKTLGEVGDKIPADEKAKVQSGIDKLKEVLKGDDTDAIKSATEELTQMFYQMSEKLYQQANPQGGAQAGPDMGGQNGGAQTGPNGQQYYDADYKVVDDDDNNKK